MVRQWYYSSFEKILYEGWIYVEPQNNSWQKVSLPYNIIVGVVNPPSGKSLWWIDELLAKGKTQVQPFSLKFSYFQGLITTILSLTISLPPLS